MVRIGAQIDLHKRIKKEPEDEEDEGIPQLFSNVAESKEHIVPLL
ncbi:unnamed protein product [Strongylus vulgaris]|uniref:Uncharacterized protein n=1 Tax=Strongylus vulgaris TaxID=40348 RepID=A0A3P7JPJ3_STRVU|nr:unnamed protein product [Strongylus vulgaris]